MGISYTFQISNLHSGSVSDRTPTKIGSQAKKKAKKKKKRLRSPARYNHYFTDEETQAQIAKHLALPKGVGSMTLTFYGY